MSKLTLTPELRLEFGKYIAENLVVKENLKGTGEYLTLSPEAQNAADIGGFSCRVNFATMGMRPIAEARQRLTQRVARDVAKLTEDEKAALLEELTR